MSDFFQLRDQNQINQARSILARLQNKIIYSDRYDDDVYEYRHVILPKDLSPLLPTRLMSEDEWRQLGIRQSIGWVHYMIHKPEQNVLLFRRPLAPATAAAAAAVPLPTAMVGGDQYPHQYPQAY